MDRYREVKPCLKKLAGLMAENKIYKTSRCKLTTWAQLTGSISRSTQRKRVQRLDGRGAVWLNVESRVGMEVAVQYLIGVLNRDLRQYSCDTP